MSSKRDRNEFNIYLEIDNKNITSVSYEVPGQRLVIGIKGDSELAKLLRDRRE